MLATLLIDNVTADESLQPRAAGLHAPTVDEYAEAYRLDKSLPPGVVYLATDGTNWLSQGFHRRAGAIKAGLTELDFEIREGTRDDAKLDAASSNAAHGLKRSNEDKRRAVRFVLELRPEWADEKAAEHVGVTRQMIGDVRAELAAEAETATVAVSESEEEAEAERDHRGSRGPKSKKEDHGRAIARALKKDHTQDDETIADEIGCKVALVARIRRNLTEQGVIPRIVAAPPPEPQRPTQKRDPLKDALGEEVPASLRDLFGDVWLAESAESLGTTLDVLKKAKRLTEKKSGAYGSFLKTETILKALASATIEVETAQAMLSEGRPHAVCPKCNGEKCKVCRNAGWLPRYRFQELKAEGKV